jgi:tRNA(Arg) A34 adenosine deaminase TadA
MPNIDSSSQINPSSESDPDIAPLRQCLHLAEASILAGGGPFGALILRDGLVLARGWNQVTTTPDPTAHAEVQAIRRAAQATGDFRLQGATLYTSCEPCPLCWAAAHWARLDRIVFCAGRKEAAEAGFDDDAFYQEMDLPAQQRKLPMRRILSEEGEGPFQAWKRFSTRVHY